MMHYRSMISLLWIHFLRCEAKLGTWDEETCRCRGNIFKIKFPMYFKIFLKQCWYSKHQFFLLIFCCICIPRRYIDFDTPSNNNYELFMHRHQFFCYVPIPCNFKNHHIVWIVQNFDQNYVIVFLVKIEKGLKLSISLLLSSSPDHQYKIQLTKSIYHPIPSRASSSYFSQARMWWREE